MFRHNSGSALLIVILIWLVTSCVSAPEEPFASPTSTPSTQEERLDAYWEELNIALARLKRDVGRIEADRENHVSAFSSGVSVYTTMMGIERMTIPSDHDLVSMNFPPGLNLAHKRLVETLHPCYYLGILSMQIETVTLTELLEANTTCQETIAFLEESDEVYAYLFQCPEAHPLCASQTNESANPTPISHPTIVRVIPSYPVATTTATGCPAGCASPPPGCVIKGNISLDSGEKIYHQHGQEYYEVTTIDPRYGERWFCTEQEALANGWRKAYR